MVVCVFYTLEGDEILRRWNPDSRIRTRFLCGTCTVCKDVIQLLENKLIISSFIMP